MLKLLDPLLNPIACLPPAPTQTDWQPTEAALHRLKQLLNQRLKMGLTGARESHIKGQGLAFAELREYYPGDDIRKLDWNVFARTLTPHVREYQEERQPTIWLGFDVSPSMCFGRVQEKSVYSLQLAAIWGFLAQRQQGRLGACITNGQERLLISPSQNPQQLAHILRQACTLIKNQPKHPKSNDAVQLLSQSLTPVVSKNHRLILLSDFITSPQGWQSLQQLAQRVQVIACQLSDPVESALPSGVGYLSLIDSESGTVAQMDTHDPKLLALLKQQVEMQQRASFNRLKSLGTALCFSTEQEPVEALVQALYPTKDISSRTERRSQ